MPSKTLTLVNSIFDGVTDSLADNTSVLVEGNLIAAIGPAITLPEGAVVIDGNGRTLMPGIIEAHGHIGNAVDGSQLTGQQDWQYLAARSVQAAGVYLDYGWTTVRDAGGPTYGLSLIHI